MNYPKIMTRGLKSSLPNTSKEDGKIRFTTDTGELFIDVYNSRVQITDFIYDYTESEILNLLSPLPKIYVAKDTNKFYRYTDKWVECAASEYTTNAGTSTYAANAGTATRATNASTADYAKNASTATYATKSATATNASTATYATSSGSANNATNASTATYAINSGAATRATNAGTATYATSAGSAKTTSGISEGADMDFGDIDSI